MVNFILSIYDFLKERKALRYTLLCLWLIFSLVQLARIDFKEDISAFLPDDTEYSRSMDVYQKVNHTNRFFVVFQPADTTNVSSEALTNAVEAFSDSLKTESWEVISRIDYDEAFSLVDFVYNNAPLLLPVASYERMEAKMQPDSIAAAMQHNLESLLFPTGEIVTKGISSDPIGLFSPLVAHLMNSSNKFRYELNDGYIFTPDGTKAVVMVESPSGTNETNLNEKMLSRIERLARSVELQNQEVVIEATGAPAIAVDNARQIKQDSLWTMLVAVILILAVLFYSLRSVRSMFLIVLSLSFGWLLAIGGMACVHTEISIIVIGIASVIVGIAVNYPLHYIAHLMHCPSPRQALKEIVEPLIIGNATTVGAFCALIPLNSEALRDLGLFAAFMLVGTILFVIVFLPHFCRRPLSLSAEWESQSGPVAESVEIKRPALANKWLLGGFLILTCFFAYHSLDTGFDTNMGHINYLKDSQKRLLKDLSQMRQEEEGQTQLYVVTEGRSIQDALAQSEALGTTLLVASKAEQQKRIDCWNAFVAKHRKELTEVLMSEAEKAGFSQDAFERFQAIVDASYTPQEVDYFAPILNSGIGGVIDSGKVINIVNVETDKADAALAAYNSESPNRWAFDVETMNSSIAVSLSDNFNYISILCSLIVFVFLWLSFARIELALVAFLPMAVTWVWILGIMQLLGVQFNLVNIILATFIFGQGDDYSIFITEGLMYEYAHRRPILKSYKHSIIISATIMFIGIGVLAFAKHPALCSLGIVTVIGMAAVVLMTYCIPPLIFNWMIMRKDNTFRRSPLTLQYLFFTFCYAVAYIFQVLYGVWLGICSFVIRKRTLVRTNYFHDEMFRVFSHGLFRIRNVRTVIHNASGEDFTTPAVIVCNHQSILDPICLMALTPHVVVLTGHHVWHHPIVHQVLKFAGFIYSGQEMEAIVGQCREHVKNGYSVVVFPEGERLAEGSVGRFHNGAFLIAEKLGLDILPVYLHGLRHIMPRGELVYSPGTLTITVGERISVSRQQEMGADVMDRKKAIRKLFMAEYDAIQRQTETASYHARYLMNYYLFKGSELERKVKGRLKIYCSFSRWVDAKVEKKKVVIRHSKYGDLALLFALVHPDMAVCAVADNYSDFCLLSGFAYKPQNLTVLQEMPAWNDEALVLDEP